MSEVKKLCNSEKVAPKTQSKPKEEKEKTDDSVFKMTLEAGDDKVVLNANKNNEWTISAGDKDSKAKTQQAEDEKPEDKKTWNDKVSDIIKDVLGLLEPEKKDEAQNAADSAKSKEPKDGSDMQSILDKLIQFIKNLFGIDKKDEDSKDPKVKEKNSLNQGLIGLVEGIFGVLSKVNSSEKK